MTNVEINDAKRKVVLEEKRHVSSKISDLSRYIGFGLVAVVYTILTSDSKSVIKIYENYTFLLLLVAGLGAVTILIDYLQFVGGYFAVEAALKNEDDSYRYNPKSFWYQLRTIAFWIKQVTAFLGALLLIIVITLSASHT